MRGGVVVVGYLSIDRIVTADTTFDAVPGGAALYAALGARAAGASVSLVACAGADWQRRWSDALADLAIDIAAIERRAGPTRRARLAYANAGTRHSPHHDDAAWWERTDALAPPRIGAGSEDIVVAGPMRAATLRRVIDDAGRTRVVADTSEAFAAREADAIRALLPSLAAFMPSREETRLLDPSLEPAAALAALCPVVIEKRGAEGLVVHRAGAAPVAVAAAEATILDPTGAGDATVGAIAAGLASGADIIAAARAAVAIGARCVSSAGPEALGLAWRGGAQ